MNIHFSVNADERLWLQIYGEFTLLPLPAYHCSIQGAQRFPCFLGSIFMKAVMVLVFTFCFQI